MKTELSIMPTSERRNNVNATNTVSALNAPDSNFHALAERASDLIARKVVEDEEGMIPHN